MDAIDLTLRTVRATQTPQFDYARLTKLQRDLIHWLESDDSDDG